MPLAYDIAKALYSGNIAGTGNGGFVTCCPVHGDKHPSMSIWDDGDGGVNVDCKTGCDGKDIKDCLVNMGLLPEWKPGGDNKYTTPIPPSKPKEKPTTPEKSSFIWNQASKDPWDLENIKKYLANRKITIDPLPACLKWNSYRGKDGKVNQMVVAAASKLGDNNPCAVQRLFIDIDNHVKTGAKMHGPCEGRGVWFDRKEDLKEILVGEGIETVLSGVQATGKNGVACLSTSGMRSLIIPDETKTIYILVYSDPVREKIKASMPRQKAAYTLAERFVNMRPGRKAFFVTPDDTCFSSKPNKLYFNDLLKEDPTGESIRARIGAAVEFHDSEWKPTAKENVQTDHDEKLKSPQEIFSKYAISDDYINSIGHEVFLYPNLIIKNHILTIIAESGGGKTTFLFFYVAPHIAEQGYTVLYFDADSPPSDPSTHEKTCR